MIQRDPLSPTISNVVVDAVLCKWVSVVAYLEGESGSKGFGRDLQRMVAYLYSDNGVLASTRVARLQR